MPPGSLADLLVAVNAAMLALQPLMQSLTWLSRFSALSAAAGCGAGKKQVENGSRGREP